MSKYYALFHDFSDLYILCVSYWCSNYYIFLCTFNINILVCLDHSLNIWQYFNQSLSKHLTATANNTYEFCFCDYLMVFIVIKLSITDILFLPAACICGILLLFFPFCVIFTNTCTFDFYYHLYRYFWLFVFIVWLFFVLFLSCSIE